MENYQKHELYELIKTDDLVRAKAHIYHIDLDRYVSLKGLLENERNGSLMAACFDRLFKLNAIDEKSFKMIKVAFINVMCKSLHVVSENRNLENMTFDISNFSLISLKVGEATLFEDALQMLDIENLMIENNSQRFSSFMFSICQKNIELSVLFEMFLDLYKFEYIDSTSELFNHRDTLVESFELNEYLADFYDATLMDMVEVDTHLNLLDLLNIELF